jgi:hypothetical protein
MQNAKLEQPISLLLCIDAVETEVYPERLNYLTLSLWLLLYVIIIAVVVVLSC